MKKNKHRKGFTIIEIIIYIALFSLLLGTAFVAVYELIEGSDKLSAKNTTLEEGSFVMRKLNWALTGASGFTNTSDTLHIEKYDGNQIEIELAGTKIKMTESAGPDDFLTTDNVSVDSLEFTPTGGTPPGMTAKATIDGTDFTITKYIRQ